MSISSQQQAKSSSIASAEVAASDRQALLRQITPALLSVDSFCRAKGLDDIAASLGDMLNLIERELTK